MDATATAWARNLLDDVPSVEFETATAEATDVQFYVNKGPMLAAPTPIVTVDGVAQTEGVQYEIPPERDRFVFNSPPGADKNLTFRYSREMWGDAELAIYQTEAEKQYTETRHIAYRTAIYGIDSVLVSAAKALNFGSGQEEFDMVSVWERLQALRTLWVEWLTQDVEESGVITIVDVIFDSMDPGFPGGYDPEDVISYPLRVE